jgi:predicted  nucleic acid-binding Zn-ribbon protein
MIVPFDINATSLELKGINNEISRLQKQVNELKKKKKTIEEKIQTYFNENAHKGVIINEMKIESIIKTKTKALPKKEKDEEIKKLLSNYVESPHIVADQLKQITQGHKIDKQQIVVKKM